MSARALTRAFAVALACATIGCAAGDPCDGKPQVCVTVKVTGAGLPALDQLDVRVLSPGGAKVNGSTGRVTPRIDLPVRFAALLPETVRGTIEVGVDGVAGSDIVARGAASVDIGDSGRAHVEVGLTGITGDGGGGGDAGGGDGGGSSVELTPQAIDLGRVVANDRKVAIFTLTARGDVTIQSMALKPQPPSISFDTATTCSGGQAVAGGNTCQVVVAFAPQGPASADVTLEIVTTGGRVTSTVRARSPGWIDESIADTSVTFNAVWAADRDTIFAVGAPNAIYVREAGTWVKRSPAVASVTSWTGVWAGSADDLYAVAPLLPDVYTSDDRGMHWKNTPLGLSQGPLSIVGLDVATVFVGGKAGDIVVGSSGTTWVADRKPDALEITHLDRIGTEAAFERADSVQHRTLPVQDSWMPVYDAMGAATFRGAWGATADFSVVGAFNSCPQVGCGTIYRVRPGNVTINTIANTKTMFGVFGSTAGMFYAVGDAGSLLTSPGDGNWNFVSPRPTTQDLHAVHGAGIEIFVVGSGGFILHGIE